jgi:hypothetical protein
MNAPDEISRDPDISAATIAVCHDVKPAAFCHAALSHNISAKGKPSPASSAGRRGGDWPEPKVFPTEIIHDMFQT